MSNTWSFIPASNTSAANLCTLIGEMASRINNLYTKYNLTPDSWKTTTTWSNWSNELSSNRAAPIYVELINDMRYALWNIYNSYTFTPAILVVPSANWIHNSRTTNNSNPFYVTTDPVINNCTRIRADIFRDIMNKIEQLESM